MGLFVGTTLGKAAFKESDKPKFIDDFNPTNWFKPSEVRCLLFLIIS
jgi:hypothetical protein